MMRRYSVIMLALLLSMMAFGQQRKKVALVLGGGGAKGAATVGVLKYVEEAGIPVDYVVGTSIGSIVGGLYSAGYRSQELDSMFRSQNWLSLLTDHRLTETPRLVYKEDGTTYVMGIPLNLNLKKKDEKRDHVSGIGLLKGDSITSTLDRMLKTAPLFSKMVRTDSLSFDSLPIPFRCVAVDMSHFEEVVLDHGNVASAMRASMAIPFVFRPMKIDNTVLVDGGVLNNLPTDVAKAMGADIIIAIDLSVEKHENEDYINLGIGDSSFLAPLSKLPIFNYMKWGLNRPDVRKYNENVKLADILINPVLDGYAAQSFTTAKIAEMITLGEAAGKEALPDLMELKKKIYNLK